MAVNKYIIQLVVDTGNGEAKVKGVSKVFDDLDKKVTRAKTSMDKGKKALDGMGGAAGTAGATAAEFGRLISDLPYGIQAVTNNISQLGSMFALLVSSSNGVGGALKNLGKILMGPAGILIAFQAVVAAIDFFAQSQRRAKKDIEDTTAAIDLQTEAVKRIIGAFDVDELVRKFGLLTGDGIGGAFDNAEARISGLVEFLSEKSPEFREAIEALSPDQMEDFGLLQRLVKDYEGINNLRLRAKRLENDILEAREKGNDVTQLEADLFQTELAIFERLKNLKPVPRENLDEFEEAIQLSDKLVEKIVGVKNEIEDPIVGFFDIKNLEEDVLEDVKNLLQPIEDARRASFDQLLEGNYISYYENELNQLQAFLENKKNLEDISFEEYKKLKLEEKNLSEFITEAKIRDGLAEVQARQQVYDAISNSLGALSGVFAEGTAASKGFALAQIAFDTATGFSQGLSIAQKSAAGTGPAAAFAFPIFYASQVAAVLTAIGKAKEALSKGKQSASVPTVSAPSVSTPSAPAFNLVGTGGQSQLAQAIAGQQQSPIKAYVVAGEVTTAQSLERNKVKEASI